MNSPWLKQEYKRSYIKQACLNRLQSNVDKAEQLRLLRMAMMAGPYWCLCKLGLLKITEDKFSPGDALKSSNCFCNQVIACCLNKCEISCITKGLHDINPAKTSCLGLCERKRFRENVYQTMKSPLLPSEHEWENQRQNLTERSRLYSQHPHRCTQTHPQPGILSTGREGYRYIRRYSTHTMRYKGKHKHTR